MTHDQKNQILALQRDLLPSGKLTACIEAGFIRGTVSGQQGEALKQHLTAMLALVQNQGSTIKKLTREPETAKAELTKQAIPSLFN